MTRPAPASKSTLELPSDKATASFVRRVLCSHQAHAVPSGRGAEPPPIQELLPPLTSSNDVDLQLYAFISILIKEYVHTWYTRISPDHVFVSEVVLVIAHCTRALEERARRLDFEDLIFNDIASLLDAHVEAYHTAKRAGQVPAPSSSARLVYHTLRPHPALSPFADGQDQAILEEQQQNYSVYRQLLAQGILAVLLPTEDLQNPCLRALVSEITADLIIGNFIGNRICESAFVYDSIRKASITGQARLGMSQWAFDKTPAPKNRLNQFGLVASRSSSHTKQQKPKRSISNIFALLAQYAVLAFGAIRILVQILASSASLPARTLPVPVSGSSQSFPNTSVTAKSPAGLSSKEEALVPTLTPIIEYQMWSTGSRLVSFPLRMPWLNGVISLVHLFLTTGPGQLGKTNHRLDRLLAHHLLAPLFPLSKYLPSLLLNLRVALFPNNALPPTNPLAPSSSSGSSAQEEAAAAAHNAGAKRAAAFAVLNLLPEPVARLYFSAAPAPAPQGDASAASGSHTDDTALETMVAGVEAILDVFGDEYMNRHFALAVLERVVVALVPELAEGKGVAELLAERGVGVEGAVA